MTTTVAEEAVRLRGIADAGPIGKRHSSFELYALLAGCMALAERCRDPEEYETLRMAVAMRGGNGGPRRYVERNSDAYTLVCRFVFDDHDKGVRKSTDRSSSSRYAHTLREADRLGFDSRSIYDQLRHHGGVNALFLLRPLEARTCTLKTLYLAKAITVPKHGEFTLTLSRNSDGSFAVASEAAT